MESLPARIANRAACAVRPLISFPRKGSDN